MLFVLDVCIYQMHVCGLHEEWCAMLKGEKKGQITNRREKNGNREEEIMGKRRERREEVVGR